MRQMISRIKEHEVDTNGEDYNTTLEEFEISFDEAQQKVFLIKNAILPLKQIETITLKKDIQEFSDSIQLFRQEFLDTAPFSYDPNMSIEEIDKQYDIIDNSSTDWRATESSR
jgi:hypothetical protein